MTKCFSYCVIKNITQETLINGVNHRGLNVVTSPLEFVNVYENNINGNSEQNFSILKSGNGHRPCILFTN